MHPRDSQALASVLLLAGLFAAPSPCHAVWPFSGIHVAEGTSPAVRSDGSGGLIVAWQTGSPGGSLDIRAQYYDASGIPIGPPGGVAVCTAPGDQTLSGIVEDSSDGAIVYWQDQRAGIPVDLYAQRITSATVAVGTTEWATDGVVINDAIGNQINCSAVSDGAGGAFFTWQGGSPFNIFAQRLDITGTQQWGVAGTSVCLAAGSQQTPQIARTAAGGAIIVWTDPRSGESAIYAQELDASGVAQWASNGIPVYSSSTGIRNSPRIATGDNVEFVVSWIDQRPGAEGIYVQKLAPPGLLGWDPAGVRVSTTVPSTYGILPRSVTDGVFVAWAWNLDVAIDIVTGAGVRLHPGGPPVWTFLLPGSQSEVRLVGDGSGGAIMTWLDNRSSSTDIFAQRFSAAGNPEWFPPDGVPVAVSPAFKSQLAVGAGDAGDLLVAWPDQRSPLTAGVYVQRLESASLPMTHVVSSTSDGALRTAIETANANPGVHHRIAFDLAGTGPHTIDVATPLPAIAVSTLLDGASQPGTVLNGAAPGGPSTGGPSVELRGSFGSGWGLDAAAPDCAIRGLAIGDFDAGGVRFGAAASEGSMEACHVGADAAGAIARPNGGDGVSVLATTGAVYVGTAGAASRNVIVASAGAGVYAGGGAAVSVAGSHIGVAANGAALGNTGDGIRLASPTTTAHIGAASAQAGNALHIPVGGNAIGYNAGAGIRVEASVGPSVLLSANGIDANGGLAIDTAEPGPNSGAPAVSYTPAPAITRAFLHSPNALEVMGSVSGPPDVTVTVQVFASDACDASGFGEGARYVGAFPVALDGGGSSAFTRTVTVTEGNGLSVQAGDAIAAVAIVSGGPVSEHSACQPANNTAAGTSVSVSLDDPASSLSATLTFDEVTAEGASRLTTSDAGPEVPSSFQIGDPPLYWDVTTTAPFTGVEVCLHYDEGAIGVPESDLALLHFDAGASAWEDVTTSMDLDENTICGTLTSLSPFIVARQTTVDVEGGELPLRVHFQSASANPSWGGVRFALKLPRAMPVELRVHDTAGRVIRRLATGERWTAGRHTVEWGAVDGEGRRVPAGVYFVAGRAGAVSIGSRIVVLR